MWFLNYFLAKFLEILTTGSLEIGKFLQRQSVSIFRETAHALHLTEFLGQLLDGSSGSFRLKQTNSDFIRHLPNHRKHEEKNFVAMFVLLFKGPAGFYTTPLTARKLCSATLTTDQLSSTLYRFVDCFHHQGRTQ